MSLIEKETPRSYEIKLHVPYGEHVFQAMITRRDPTPEEVKLRSR